MHYIMDISDLFPSEPTAGIDLGCWSSEVIIHDDVSAGCRPCRAQDDPDTPLAPSSPDELLHVPDDPHDDDPEERAELDDVPDEDGDAVQRVHKGEHLPAQRERDDVAVA